MPKAHSGFIFFTKNFADGFYMSDNVITSSQNNIFKHILKLTEAKYRNKFGEFVLEGERLVNDAYGSGAEILFVVLSKGYNGKIPPCDKIYIFDEKLFSQIKNTVNSQGILAVVKIKKDASFDFANSSTVVYLDGVSDPGNMGTIIRTCDAAGVDAVILSKNCVDVFNPKVVRSTMASIFNVKIIFDDDHLEKLKNNGFCLIGTHLSAKKSIFDIDFLKKCVIIIGNEANGISKDVIDMCSEKVIIPMVGKCESLNAAVSCSVCVYEALRQKLAQK